MNDNVLIHYGKKGMKWGHRKEVRDTIRKFNGGADPVKRKITTGQMNTFKSGTDAAKSGTDAAKNINSTVAKVRAKKKVKDISEMSDKDLQQVINRMGMEQRYSDLATSKEVSKGHINVDNVMSVAGGVLGVASSAIGIAVAIKTLKGA